MLEDGSFWSVLSIARWLLLLAGVCGVAVWAVRQPDQETAFLKRLMERRSGRCGGGGKTGGGIGT